MRATTNNVDLFEYWQENKESRARIDLLQLWETERDKAPLIDLFELWSGLAKTNDRNDIFELWKKEAFVQDDIYKHYKILSSLLNSHPFQSHFLFELEKHPQQVSSDLFLIRDPVKQLAERRPLLPSLLSCVVPLEVKDLYPSQQTYELVLLNEGEEDFETLILLSDIQALAQDKTFFEKLIFLKKRLPRKLKKLVLFIEVQGQHYQNNALKNIYELEQTLREFCSARLEFHLMAELGSKVGSYTRSGFYDFNYREFCSLGGSSEFLMARELKPLHALSCPNRDHVYPLSPFHGVNIYGA